MTALRCFIDTHDTAKGTLPEGLTADGLKAFLTAYDEACRAEGVVLIRIEAGLADGRAFCLTMAPDAEAVRRAHARVGLPFDSITEVRAAAPSSLFAA